MAYTLVRRMRKIEGGLPGALLAHMYLNIIVDFAVGLVPLLGDLADAYVKCNSKNVRLLEKRLDELHKPEALQREDEQRERKTKRKTRPATVYEDFSDEEIERLNSSIDNSHEDVRQPNRAYSPGRRERIRDEEMGHPQRKARR